MLCSTRCNTRLTRTLRRLSASATDFAKPSSAVRTSAPLTALTQQANAQGQTIVASSGDSGPADCDYSTDPNNPVKSATHGYAVDMPASLPYVTAMGGNEFSEGDDTGATQYWSGTNNGNNGSALSYIPEMVWNDTATDGFLAASGGGVSKLFSKPSWQTGAGVPADGQRDVPDLALSASADHDGYLICSQSSCVTGYRKSDQTLTIIGGTSAAAPDLCRHRGADRAKDQRSARATSISTFIRWRRVHPTLSTTSPLATTWCPAPRVQRIVLPAA